VALFWLHVDLPGPDPEAVDLTVEKNTLTITPTTAEPLPHA